VVRDVNPAAEMLACDADATICIGPITNPDLVAHKVGAVRSITCASPDFIECTGVPRSPAYVDPDHCIAVFEAGTDCAREWVFRRKSESYAILPTAPLAFSDADAAIIAAVRGGGYARVLCIDAEQQIAAGLLRPVLSDWNDDSQPVAMVHEQHRHANKDVLAFRAFIASILPSDITPH
jgi:LysR family transcriptional regulator, regulator for bpeEF and oprC